MCLSLFYTVFLAQNFNLTKMEYLFIFIVGLLFILAISDLIVGVSNDAVNFLNSAIGSKAAPLRVILIVAALGVLAGATFSNGMMEVARKGIFVPEAFTFKEIMIIFLAVMLTDVILLDLFNTFGLPTSTTVSIVFELLGAAVGIVLVKYLGQRFDPDVAYINSGKALTIIFGILLSVVVAFSVGAIIQWISRLLFTFNFESNTKYFGGIFGGIAVTTITYFILIKGLKGSVYADQIVGTLSLKDWADFLADQGYNGFKALVKSLGSVDVPADISDWASQLKGLKRDNYQLGVQKFVDWTAQQNATTIQIPLSLTTYVKYHTLTIILISFGAFSLLLQALYSFFKINILKFVVIIGTFALAMAFASNDLVNFIGVPLAGLRSVEIHNAAGGSTPDMLMGALSGKVETKSIFLLIAGLIMVITLWLSKKSRSVVKTTLNLSDQDEVNERFESNGFARALVRVSVRIGSGVGLVVPQALKNQVKKRFEYTHVKKPDKKEGVSFDLIRASVNLVVASILIAIGTSLKLPLSTTYVTFMVAMGTSLADGAWDRESAVYRITGVITVIGGWFFTAISAFTCAFLVAILIYATWWVGVFVLALLALFIVYRTQILHKKRTAEENQSEKADSVILKDSASIYENCTNNVVEMLLATGGTINDTVDYLGREKRKGLKETYKRVSKLDMQSKKLRKKIPEVFKDLSEESFEIGQDYVEIIDFMREAMHSLFYITSPAFKHIDNNHKPITTYQQESLQELATIIANYLEQLVESISKSDFSKSAEIIEKALEISELTIKIRKKQLKLIKKEPGSARTNLLFLDILNESKNLVLNLNNMYKSFRDFNEHYKASGLKQII